MMKKIFLVAMLSGVAFVGCNNTVEDLEGTDITGYEMITINPILLTEQLKNNLDFVFSENNELVKNIQGDTLFYVINSKEELLELSSNINTVTDIDIDFENHSIIWGRFTTSSISNKITWKQLGLLTSISDPSSANYRYEIAVEHSTNAWTAIGRLYFWGIYPRKITETVELRIGELRGEAPPPYSLSLYDKDSVTIQNQIQGKWNLLFIKDGVVDNEIHSYTIEFTADKKYITHDTNLMKPDDAHAYHWQKKPDTLAYYWQKHAMYTGSTDSICIMMLPAREILFKEIRNDALIYSDASLSDPKTYFLVKRR